MKVLCSKYEQTKYINVYERKEDQFNVMRSIQKKSELTQRELAQKLNVSLGKINYCLTALKKRDTLK